MSADDVYKDEIQIEARGFITMQNYWTSNHWPMVQNITILQTKVHMLEKQFQNAVVKDLRESQELYL